MSLLPTPTPVIPAVGNRRRYRPVSPSDSAASTGKAVNPIGAMVPYSQMAAYGAQGQFGASLPTPFQTPAQGTNSPPLGANLTPVEKVIYKTFNNPVGRAYVKASDALYSASNYLNTPGPLIPTTPIPSANKDANQYNTNPLDPNSLAGGTFSDPKGQAIAYLASGQINSLTPAQAESLGLSDALADPQSGWTIDPKTNAWVQAAGADVGRNQDMFGNAWDKNTAKTDIYGGRFIQEGSVKFERIGGQIKRVQYLANGEKKVMRGHGNLRGASRKQARKERAQFTGNFGVVNFSTGSG